MLGAEMLDARQDQATAEERLWMAVITSTIMEWTNGPLRRRREAEQFLFQDENDFELVCISAGINPASIRERLGKILEQSQVRLEQVAA
jgi:hypothetical protein